jgi:hypothetical protein
VSVPGLRVGQRQPTDTPRQFAVPSRPGEQVPVVGQNAVGQKPCPLALDSFFQDSLERLVDTAFLEDGHAGVGAIEHVVDQAAVVRSFWPSDEPELNVGLAPLSMNGSINGS